MGRNLKSKYPRNVTCKFRTSQEHLDLLANVIETIPMKVSAADVLVWALEEFASKHFKNKIKFIPHTQPKWKAKQRGKTIIIGKEINT